jgi:hypothetical protein
MGKKRERRWRRDGGSSPAHDQLEGWGGPVDGVAWRGCEGEATTRGLQAWAGAAATWEQRRAV